MEYRTYLTPEERRATSRDTRPLEVIAVRDELGRLLEFRSRPVDQLRQSTGSAINGAAATEPPPPNPLFQD